MIPVNGSKAAILSNNILHEKMKAGILQKILLRNVRGGKQFY